MYHVIETGSVTILLYLLSYLLSRTGYFPTLFHKKIWNSILALSFIITAGAGLFLALQANYKWNIPFIKTMLKWHSEFGVAMSLTGFFHLIIHYSYFRKLFNQEKKNQQKSEFRLRAGYSVTINLFIVGMVSTSFQLLLIREMMNITGGFELITGIFLGSWLIASAAGSSLAGRSEMSDLKKINLIFAISPLISIVMLMILSAFFLSPGQTPSFLASIIITLLVLFPFCLVSGFTFVKLIFVARLSEGFPAGKSFSIETAGGIISGILIPLLTSGILNTYQVLLLIIILSLAYVTDTFLTLNKKFRIALRTGFALVASAVIICNPDIMFRQVFLPAIKVNSSVDTPYGNITKGSYKGENSIYYNQRLIGYKNDVTEREEDIHYAMLQRENHGKVILVSGMLESHLPEILKYPVKKVVYIERDPNLALSGKKVADSLKGKLEVENSDIFSYLVKNKEKSDAIILLVPPPTTLLLNRYYTTEFFFNIKKSLLPGGVFVCSPGPGDTYFNKGSLNLFSSVYNSLRAVFKNVKPVCGEKLYLIASDEDISLSFCYLVEKRHISNIYVCPDYLSDDLISGRSEEVALKLGQFRMENRNMYPVATLFNQEYSLSKNLNDKIPAIFLLLLIFGLPAVAVRRMNLLMYFSAAALSGFEIIAIFSLQLISGNMYQLTGLIVAGLMSGLAVGSGTEAKYLSHMSIYLKGTFLVVFYAFIGLTYKLLITSDGGALSIALIIIIVFIPSFVTGQIFREMTRGKDSGLQTSAVYSADLAGSALGFIMVSGFIVPVFGIPSAIFLSSILIFTGTLFGLIRGKQ